MAKNPAGFSGRAHRRRACPPSGRYSVRSRGARASFAPLQRLHAGIRCEPATSRTPSAPRYSTRSNGDRMTLALRSFALIIVFGPRLGASRRPGKLIQHIAQGLEAGGTALGMAIVPTLLGNGGRARQGLHLARTPVARPVISPFGQQPPSQPLPSARQAGKDGAVGMLQKNAERKASLDRGCRLGWCSRLVLKTGAHGWHDALLAPPRRLRPP